MKKFVSLFIALLLVFGTFAVYSVSAEETKAELTLNGVKYEAEKGDTVVFRMELQSVQTVEAGQFIIYYPDSILKAENGGLKDVKNPHFNIKKSGEVNSNFSDKDGIDFTQKKLLLEVEFSVISGGSGEFSQDEKFKRFYNTDDKKITEGLEIFESIEVKKPEPEPETTVPETASEDSSSAEGTQNSSSVQSESSEQFDTAQTVETQTESATQPVSDTQASTDPQESSAGTVPEISTASSESAASETTSSVETATTAAATGSSASTETPETAQSKESTASTEQPKTQSSEETTAQVQTEPAESNETTATASTQPVETIETDPVEETTSAPKVPYVKAKASYLPLKASAKKVSNKAVKLSWSKVKNVSSYIVYGCKANGKYKKLKTVSTNSFTVKKLKKGTYYQFCIKALNGKAELAKSQTVYAVTNGSKYSNPTGIKVNKKIVDIKAKKSFVIKTKLLKPSDKKLKSKKVYFVSTNSKIASVNSKGKITAKKKGKANIYAYAANGVGVMLKIRVK